MSLLDDVRAVSENAIEQLAARFSELPRPLLVAIGAGDMAVARFADLRKSVADSLPEGRIHPPAVEVTDVRAAVADLPAKVQKAAADVAANLESLAAEAPAKAQQLITQLPAKLAEVQAAAQTLSPDAIGETMDAYARLVGMIYGNLAERGGATWTKVRTVGLRPATGIASRPDRSTGDTAAARAAAAVRAATQAPARSGEPITADRSTPADTAEPRAATAPAAADGRITTGKPRVARPKIRSAGPDPVEVTPADVIPKGAVVKQPTRKPRVRRTEGTAETADPSGDRPPAGG